MLPNFAPQLLAMEGSALLTPAIRAQVAKFLADDVLAHLNHTTTGIVSWKAQLDALARNGYQELAFALMSQKAYPGLGYEALNKMATVGASAQELQIEAQIQIQLQISSRMTPPELITIMSVVSR